MRFLAFACDAPLACKSPRHARMGKPTGMGVCAVGVCPRDAATAATARSGWSIGNRFFLLCGFAQFTTSSSATSRFNAENVLYSYAGCQGRCLSPCVLALRGSRSNTT